MQTAITGSVPQSVRQQLTDTIEEIGQAMGLLREANDEIEAGNIDGAKICSSDALFIISDLEARYSELAATLAKWSEN